MISLWEEANLLQAEQEEKHLVHEFRERLRYNLQQVSAAVPLSCDVDHIDCRSALYLVSGQDDSFLMSEVMPGN